MLDRKEVKDSDLSILLVVFFIFVVGVLAIYSASQAKGEDIARGYALRQIVWMAMGTALLLPILKISYQRFIDISGILYGVNILLLVLVLILGKARLGAQRWFSIGAFTLQPSEFIKLTFILALSSYVGFKKEAMSNSKELLIPILILSIPFGLVLMQPDLGTALLLVPIFFSMLFVGGAKPRHLIAMILLGLLSLPFFWNLLLGYQRQRLLVFINPNTDPLGAGYTIIQSKIAIGSGGIFGKGYLSGTQNQLNFLPERHTDFIFSVLGEEWGLVGTSIVVILYAVVVRTALEIASSTSDIYGKLVATGIAVMLAAEVIVNIGMTIGLMPVVGIPLPLMSYGGSNMVSTVIALGLLINVRMRRSMF